MTESVVEVDPQAKDLNARLLQALRKARQRLSMPSLDVHRFLRAMKVTKPADQLQVLLAAGSLCRQWLIGHSHLDEEYDLYSKIEELVSKAYESLRKVADLQWEDQCGQFFTELAALRAKEDGGWTWPERL